jgi:zinc transport system substrate-binding protein
VLSGTEFEAALRPKIEALFPELPVIDGVEGVRFRGMDEEPPDGEDHGGAEERGGRDPHTWLGPEGAKIMAAHILEALSRLDPPQAALYGENYRSLIRDIDETFDRLRRDLEPLRGSTVFVYHPAFGYFLDEFGIVQRAVETGGKEPTPRRLGRLIEDARKAGVRVVFVQAQFPLESAGTAARAAGAELAALDPLAEDWLANIGRMGEALKEAGAR